MHGMFKRLLTSPIFRSPLQAAKLPENPGGSSFRKFCVISRLGHSTAQRFQNCWTPLLLGFSSGNGKSLSERRHKSSRYNSPGSRQVPKLFYIQNPFTYVKNKLDLLKLKLLWDFSFSQKDFVYGASKAVVVMTDYIRDQNASDIQDITTLFGFKQIARDMVLSRKDPRLQLLNFRVGDIQKVVPVKVHRIKKNGRKHCLIDAFFVGMRNINDFNTTEESDKILEHIQKLCSDNQNKKRKISKNKIIFAEIYTRFYREFTEGVQPEWSVAFYKVANFGVL